MTFWSEIGSGFGELDGTHDEEFPGVPLGSNNTLLINKTMKNIMDNLIKSNCRLMNPGETHISGL